MPDKPTLVIAEDDFLIGESLRVILQPEFNVLAVVDDGAAAIEAAARHHPAVMLLDISLPVLKGFDAARAIRKQHPDIKLLFVSSYSDRAYVDEARAMGASGYVLKSRVASELPQAIRTALGGKFFANVI
jgi:DNA-binding NarL/FixJ family response regulator